MKNNKTNSMVFIAKCGKKVSVILLILTLFLSLISCANNSQQPKQQIKEMSDYSVLLYQNAAGGGGDTYTTKYNGPKFYNTEYYEKSNMPKKQSSLFGNSLELFYDKTSIFSFQKKEFDVYEASHEDRLLIIYYHSDTKKIARYLRYAPCTDRNFKSAVNPQSSEKEFLEYVSSILLEQAGVSTKDWNVQVATKIINKDKPAEFKNVFYNNSKEVIDFNAEYTFVFYKTIDGISRTDNMSISVTNVGEVISFDAMENEKMYAPFKDAKIDRDKLISAVESSFSGVKNEYDVISHNISLKVVPTEVDLWVEATVEFRFQAGEEVLGSGVKYVIKVAELA